MTSETPITEAELVEMEKMAEAAHEEICSLAVGSRKWTMSIPADKRRDSDLVLQTVVDDNKRLIAEVRRLNTENARQDALLDEINTRLAILDPKMDNIAAIVQAKDAELARLREEVRAHEEVEERIGVLARQLARQFEEIREAWSYTPQGRSQEIVRRGLIQPPSLTPPVVPSSLCQA